MSLVSSSSPNFTPSVELITEQDHSCKSLSDLIKGIFDMMKAYFNTKAHFSSVRVFIEKCREPTGKLIIDLVKKMMDFTNKISKVAAIVFLGLGFIMTAMYNPVHVLSYTYGIYAVGIFVFTSVVPVVASLINDMNRALKLSEESDKREYQARQDERARAEERLRIQIAEDANRMAQLTLDSEQRIQAASDELDRRTNEAAHNATEAIEIARREGEERLNIQLGVREAELARLREQFQTVASTNQSFQSTITAFQLSYEQTLTDVRQSHAEQLSATIATKDEQIRINQVENERATEEQRNEITALRNSLGVQIAELARVRERNLALENDSITLRGELSGGGRMLEQSLNLERARHAQELHERDELMRQAQNSVAITINDLNANISTLTTDKDRLERELSVEKEINRIVETAFQEILDDFTMGEEILSLSNIINSATTEQGVVQGTMPLESLRRFFIHFYDICGGGLEEFRRAHNMRPRPQAPEVVEGENPPLPPSQSSQIHRGNVFVTWMREFREWRDQRNS